VTYRVIALSPAATFPLRQQVLRPHQRVEEMALEDDEDASTGTYGAVDDDVGEVVSCARVAPAPAPAVVELAGDARTAWQLRAMATRPDVRKLGIGSAVLEAAIDHAARHGGGVLWCNARTAARTLYRRAGFVEFGAEWDEPHIGSHIVMARTVDPSTPGPNRESSRTTS
jgi:GNAT superfamily N-acetyltransferase